MQSTKYFRAVLAVGALALASTAALADEVIISTGYEGGSYHNVFGRNLGHILAEQRHDVTLVTSAGSRDNLERLSRGEADVAFTQADAYAAFAKTNTGMPANIIGSLTEECLFVAVGDHTGFDDEDDLQAEGVKIAVGEQGSGSAMSWDFARELEPGYAAASTYYQGGILALSQVRAGQMDAFFWVTAPGNLDHKYLQAVNMDNSGLHMIDFNDWDMNDTLPNGESVYEFKDVKVEDRRFGGTVEVPCTDVLVVARPDMASGALESVATAIMMNTNRILGR